MSQIKDYLEFMKYGRNLSENTLIAIENDFNVYGVDLSIATRKEVEQFVISQNKENLSTATVARRVASLKGFFEWQIYNGHRVGINPASGKIAPKIRNKSHEAITYPELNELYNNAPTDTLKIAIALSGFVGMRIGEIVGVGNRNPIIKDVDGSYSVHLKDTKGNNERKVTLALISDTCLIERLVGSGGLLGKRGVLSENGLWRQMRDYFDTTEHKDLSPHGLRATFATISVERNVRVDVVRDMLGHTSLGGNNITSRYVSATSVQEQKNELIGKWLNS